MPTGTVSDAMRTAAQAERGPATWLGRVVGHRRIGWDLAVVQVAATEPVPYRAGQYLSVETPQRPRLWRYLSPANAPRDDGRLEFHVRAVTGRLGEPGHRRALERRRHLADRPTDGADAIARNSRRNVLMVAGGTGSAPIRAMLEDLVHGTGQPRTQVFVGGRTWDDLYDFAPLRRLSYTTRGSTSSRWWSATTPGTAARRTARSPTWSPVTAHGPTHDVLVCGSPAMIRATVARMLVAGTPLDRIGYDPFTLD